MRQLYLATTNLNINCRNSNITFLDSIPDHVLEKVRNNKAKILLNYGFEEYDIRQRDTILYFNDFLVNKLSEKNIPIEIHLFKDPVNIIEKIKNDKPDIVALAYYVWNSDLNRKIFDITKKYNKDCLTLGGGPNITSINANEKGARKFFEKQKTKTLTISVIFFHAPKFPENIVTTLDKNICNFF